MTPDQLSKLLLFIDARMDTKIQEALGRDSLSEAIRENALRDYLMDGFGFRQDRNGNPIEREGDE